MNERNHDLHGNAPDQAAAALLLIDVINDMEFEGGEELLRHALPAARRLAELKRRCRELSIPSVYVNDNFGRWQSNFQKLIDHCINDDVIGRPVAEILLPEDDDYFVLKPKHSGFFSTTLDVLLEYLGTETLIIAGFATNICVLFTASDAYMRDFGLAIPHDCSAAESIDLHETAMRQMESILSADTRPAADLDLQSLLRP